MMTNLIKNFKNSFITISVFMSLLIVLPQVSYAKKGDTLEISEAFQGYSDNDSEKSLHMNTIGISNPKKGEYKITLTFANTLQNKHLELENNYKFRLIDENGNKHEVKINRKKTDYADVCADGFITNSHICTTTLYGTAKNSDLRYVSYEIEVPYIDENGKATKQIFKDSMPEIEAKHSLEILEDDSGEYTLQITNTSDRSITIRKVELVRPCISLSTDDSHANIFLPQNSDRKFKFDISDVISEDKDCSASVVVQYTTTSGEQKISIIPINITRVDECSGLLGWAKCHWKVAAGIAGTVLVIVVISAISLLGGGSGQIVGEMNLAGNHWTITRA